MGDMEDSPREPGDARRFPTTLWPELLGIAGSDDTAALERLGQMLARYEPFVLKYLAFKFALEPGQAKDLWQSFVLDNVLARQFLTKANPGRGRFRSFLLTSLERFVISEFRRQTSKGRNPPGGLVSLEATKDIDRISAPTAQRQASDLDWARTILDEAIRDMEAECRATGREALWDVFEGRFLRPILEGSPKTDYTDLMRRHGYVSPVQASNALVSARRAFVRHLRRTVARYSDNADAAARELRDLIAALN